MGDLHPLNGSGHYERIVGMCELRNDSSMNDAAKRAPVDIG
jgi:hypothetical protein